MQKESIHSMLLAAQQQMYDYTLQLQFNRSLVTDPYVLYACHQQLQARVREQSKPSYSYIGLISMAILSSPERQLVLSDIYQWILNRYPYFRSRGIGWRNSIRHNLSLNECFVKAGRSTNGKGHYWTINPANLPDFLSGDFRRRRLRQSMTSTTPEEELDDETLPTNAIKPSFSPSTNSTDVHYHNRLSQTFQMPRKRCFDVDSLLAPDQPKRRKYPSTSKSDGSTDTDNFSC